MSEFSLEAITQSGYLRAGFAEHYDAYRPRPPGVLLDALVRYATNARPRRVVDLGSGTGLSTRSWAERAHDVVGVEANPAMLAVAEANTDAANVRYVKAFANETGLPDAYAELVTCSQSFHWMEPVSTLREAARLLRPGGVFAAYDYDVPPLVHPDIDAAYTEYLRLRRRFREEHRLRAGWTRTAKHEHLQRIEESGYFRFAREAVFHVTLELGSDEIIGFARTLGLVPELAALGVSEEELGLVGLEETVKRVLGDRHTAWVLGYRVRLGVK
jgi:ubiquinone/menaquinone biosynthesis C-methylase UbiE